MLIGAESPSWISVPVFGNVPGGGGTQALGGGATTCAGAMGFENERAPSVDTAHVVERYRQMLPHLVSGDWHLIQRRAGAT